LNKKEKEIYKYKKIFLFYYYFLLPTKIHSKAMKAQTNKQIPKSDPKVKFGVQTAWVVAVVVVLATYSARCVFKKWCPMVEIFLFFLFFFLNFYLY
jgi:hypothetical protein